MSLWPPDVVISITHIFTIVNADRSHPIKTVRSNAIRGPHLTDQQNLECIITADLCFENRICVGK